MMNSPDKWSKREQLNLVSAVSYSGDQNWMAVSRSMKLSCGGFYPFETFSQKNCAVKYGELLGSVEIPKRKKYESPDNGTAAVVETPTDYILRRLTEERIQELKSEIREEQETYAKLYTDVVYLQTGNSNEEQIRAMWMEIERENQLDHKDKVRKQISGQVITTKNNQGQIFEQKQEIQCDKQNHDVEKEEICKPQGTSPLLSSLLKSSSSAPPVTIASTVRVNAPTITNLLTGIVSVSTAEQSHLPQSSLYTNIPLSKPLTGRPGEKIQTSFPPGLSPSQSAPTLSMLLEKKKVTSKETVQETNSEAIQLFNNKSPHCDVVSEIKNESDGSTEDGSMTPTKEEEKQLLEVFKNLMPDNIDVLNDILANSQGILNQTILEEESMLGVESLISETQKTQEDQLNVLKQSEETFVTMSTIIQNDTKELISVNTIKPEDEKVLIKEKNHIPQIDEGRQVFTADINEVSLSTGERKNKESDISQKIETISKEQSCENNNSLSSNVPKYENLNEDTKDQFYSIHPSSSNERTEEEIKQVFSENIQKEKSKQVASHNDDKGIESIHITAQLSLDDRKDSISDSSDVILIPTDDEYSDGKDKKDIDGTSAVLYGEDPESRTTEKRINNINTALNKSQEAIALISLPDTDDESCNLETQSTASKDNESTVQMDAVTKPNFQKKRNSEEELKPSVTALRKLRDRDRSESPLVDDDASENSKIQRPRRRCSSMPVLDSVPNSPASGDDRDNKAWKKSLMTVYNNLLTNKNATIFLRPLTDEKNKLFRQVCRRPMDLQTIKHHIENGTIRNVVDFQRDIFLMCQNVIFTFEKNSSYTCMAKGLLSDFVQLKEDITVHMDKMSASTHGVKIESNDIKKRNMR